MAIHLNQKPAHGTFNHLRINQGEPQRADHTRGQIENLRQLQGRSEGLRTMDVLTDESNNGMLVPT